MNDAASMPATDKPGEVGLVAWEDFHSRESFTFECGKTIPGFTLRYETYGRLNKAKSNAILICHALSGDHHCAGVHDLSERKPGWWNNMIGPGKPIDTRQYFVICSNCLGGCRGSTGPMSANPDTGEPYHLDFPQLTIGDMIHAQRRLMDHFEIEKLYAVMGGSMGGMQALEWGIRYPDRVARIIPLATTGRSSAQAIAFNAVGRSAIMQDPGWLGGAYPDEEGPNVGLSIARMMAHITYLSDEGLEKKFGRARRSQQGQMEPFGIDFEVESYLHHQGQTFINRFDANTYLYFTKALDLFDLYAPTGNLEDAFRPLQARALVIGFSSDWLYPPSQNRALVHAMLRCGKHASYAEIDMPLGHDSFLVDAPDLDNLIRAFLAQNV